MPQVMMPDGQLVMMPDNPTPDFLKRVSGVIQDIKIRQGNTTWNDAGTPKPSGSSDVGVSAPKPLEYYSSPEFSDVGATQAVQDNRNQNDSGAPNVTGVPPPGPLPSNMYVPGGAFIPVTPGGIGEHIAAVTNPIFGPQVPAEMASGLSGLVQAKTNFVQNHPIAASALSVLPGASFLHPGMTALENATGITRANRDMGVQAQATTKLLTPRSTSATVLNDVIKIPVELGKFAAEGPFAPLGMAVEAAGNSYLSLKEQGMPDDKALAVSGAEGALNGVLGILPGGGEAKSMVKLFLQKTVRGFVIGSGLHVGESAIHWTYDPDGAKQLLADPKQWGKSVVQMLGYEYAGGLHQGAAIIKGNAESKQVVGMDLAQLHDFEPTTDKGRLAKYSRITDLTPKPPPEYKGQISLDLDKAGNHPLDSNGNPIMLDESKLTTPEKLPFAKQPSTPDETTALVKEATTQQDAITQLRGQRIAHQSALDDAYSDLERLRQAGRRGKSEEWGEANARVAKAIADLVDTNEQLTQQTGKTFDELQGEPSGVKPAQFNDVAQAMGLDPGPAQRTLNRVLGLDPDATFGQTLGEIHSRIDGLGKTVKETAIKIVNAVKGIGREVADKLAPYLHDVFGGTEKGQFGGVGDLGNFRDRGQQPKALPLLGEVQKPDNLSEGIKKDRPDITDEAIQRARDEQQRRRLAIEALNLPKEKKAEAMSQLPKIQELTDSLGAPATQGEADKLSNLLHKGGLTQEQTMLVHTKLRDGMQHGVVPNLAQETNTDLSMKGWLNLLAAIFTGDGVPNKETGAAVMIRPTINEDPTSVNPTRDLTKVEKWIGKIASPSHVMTGTYAKDLGVLVGEQTSGVDKHFGDCAALTNRIRMSNSLVGIMEKYGIKTNSQFIRDGLRGTRDNWADANTTFLNALKAAEDNKYSGTTRKALEDAKANLERAESIVKENLKDIYPKDSGARVVGLADGMASPEGVSDYLKQISTPEEMRAAEAVKDQMDEIKKEMDRLGVPTREDFGVPHLLALGLSSDVVKRIGNRDNSVLTNQVLNPESVKFLERSRSSILTLPDLHGIIDEYIPQATSIAARRAVANKWNFIANDIQATHPRLSELIKDDMKDYVHGNTNRSEMLDATNRAFATFLVGFNVTTAMKHVPKAFFSIADSSPIDTTKGWVNYLREVANDPSMRRLLDHVVKIGKGRRYIFEVELGSGDSVSDKLNSTTNRLQMLSHYPIQGVEGFERGMTFRSNLLGNYQRGMDPQHAMADAVFRSLMVNFQGSDKPRIMRGSLGQSLQFLQQTVWKIMELNIRRAGDLAKSVADTKDVVTGKASGEEMLRYGQAWRHAAALGAVYAIGKATNTDVFKWVTETPAFFRAFVVAPIEAMFESFHKDEPFNYALANTLGNSISAMPAFEKFRDAAAKYGFGSKGFWMSLGIPPELARLIEQPTKAESQRLGEGKMERVARRQLGLGKTSVREEQESKRTRATIKKQGRTSDREAERFDMPFSEAR